MASLDAKLQSFFDREQLPGSLRDTLATLHGPLAEYIATAARAHGRTLVVGVCGSQGSGKSTIAQMLRMLLEDEGLTTAALSLDDLYLTRHERETLAAQVHPLLQTRGVPGTHDVPLGLRTLDALRQPGGAKLPRFDKARDDRSGESEWPAVATPVDVVLFEGWCVGARAQRPEDLFQPINGLERQRDTDSKWRRFVNDALATSYVPLFARIDRLVLLQAPSFDVVYAWRKEQEQRLRERIGREERSATRVMSDDDLATFIAHYERLTRHILLEMPERADVVVELDANRAPVGVRGLVQRP